ncbi:hypothetical protein [Prosthecomicrobium sp. N25]|uniref:hypothetical protein n=1 Tax=Prosthecomicrobium sp. N25 TaxID=3129254 RepID=UPI003077CB21
MATRTITLAYTCEETVETVERDGQAAETGNLLVTVPTAGTPQGYTVAVPAGITDWQLAATIEGLWANLGRPD